MSFSKNEKLMKTVFAKKEDVQRKWYVVDAEGKVLGRLASRVASILRGKHLPTYTPHVDTGDHVIIINADKVTLTGKKLEGKVYFHHTGYIGGIKSITARKLMEKKPTEVVYHAVKGMLPKNSLGRQMIKKLKVYSGSAHPHNAQLPEKLEVER